MAEFNFKIEEEFGVLSSNDKGYSKEFKKISYNGKPAVYDIRQWYTDPETNEKKMLKGTTLTEEEFEKLKELIN